MVMVRTLGNFFAAKKVEKFWQKKVGGNFEGDFLATAPRLHQLGSHRLQPLPGRGELPPWERPPAAAAGGKE